MFSLAHLTDPHIGPLPPVALRQLLNKRLTGWINWRRGRRYAHNMEILVELLDDIRTRQADHIACTGDICNLGLPLEWKMARRFLEDLGPAEHVSFVPGNHDAYASDSLSGLLDACAPYMASDGSDGTIHFPYLRHRGKVALIGLSSAIPTDPFKAYGRLGTEQLRELELILTELGRDEDCFRVVMIHHPPYVDATMKSRSLTDAAALEQVLARSGAELVLFGHNHAASLAYLPGPRGQIPIVGAASASANAESVQFRGSYHLFHIDKNEQGFTIEQESRGLTKTGTIGLLGRTLIFPASQELDQMSATES